MKDVRYGHTRSWRELHHIGEYARPTTHRKIRRAIAKAQMARAGIKKICHHWGKDGSRLAQLWRKYGIVPKEISKLCAKEQEKRGKRKLLRNNRRTNKRSV